MYKSYEEASLPCHHNMIRTSQRQPTIKELFDILHFTNNYKPYYEVLYYREDYGRLIRLDFAWEMWRASYREAIGVVTDKVV